MASIKNLDWKDWMMIILAILLVLAALFAGIYYNKYHDASGLIVMWNDSISIYKNKLNEEYLAKGTYILKASELEAYNKELYNEYKSLKDNPVVITKTKVTTQFDTIYTLTDTVWKNGDMLLWSWSAKDSCWYQINGTAAVTEDEKTSVTVDNLNINSDITLDVIDDGNQLKVIAKSDNPYMKLTDMQSVVIDPLNSPTIKNLNKAKRWGFGPYLGVGVYSGWDLTNKSVCVGLGASIGFSVHYDLIQW